MAHHILRAGLAIGMAAITLAGCASYVKRDEFDAAIAELRSADQRLQEQIDALSQKHDALVTQMAGRIRVDTGAHFATDDATVSDEAKLLLDDFAKAIHGSHPDAYITVEGFADPSGSTAYNKALGLRRAEAVREYLVSSGGLLAGQIRSVSYGEAPDRLVRPGATGDAGRDNRRVALVIDYVGNGPVNPAPTM